MNLNFEKYCKYIIEHFFIEQKFWLVRPFLFKKYKK